MMALPKMYLWERVFPIPRPYIVVATGNYALYGDIFYESDYILHAFV